ncbi:16S rRNA (guanine(527)-N(7))-methyltransferase RsmG [Corynebacterium propinquum]|uniref:Ribosomal RNA small subunit methyltransferase G n=1 Tax=Corynebacterium propinquum TaxID=43769 RepID=A0AAP4FB54_9CORY|nr:16S rRNA (guanine(527)-N(7))-methyltransferase RsmG [Corynebacterium propinquum]MCG7231903.1 16S rRNA (guanine(527)-N(7))-methyltransferase RsmG [Corynebacterium propinquum]MDK4234826.1 16S rRNA (guanine(527)-N(7))-methyltransferase RsmG [Corynebacterium propinquum]MDK4239237.1 16S rRNA (guanine(527)-N(7))-methyltransferase RsmG [Corynebacterium propinquum]MDK4251924.1 16S rRNA (guanine(527)-N(7))-methyltransferase RsmG [Corynebacterium propinquum]MDK4300506.1 16S rRNA (guanine(527)-N(7))-m
MLARIFGDRQDLAVAYHESLATDATTRGFIGPREKPRLWDRHIYNCAVIGEAIPEGARVIDIGSGAGLPGIPLAIARPDLQVTLLEPLLKRSNYLAEITEKLGLDNVTVIRDRAENLGKDAKFDVVTSRAVAPLAKLARWSLPLCKPGGMMLAMKGASASEEIERDKSAIKRAQGERAEIITVGAELEESTTLIRVHRVK